MGRKVHGAPTFADVTVAVTRHGWESYHSPLNPGSSAHLPARQLCAALSLTSRPQTFDLFDPAGHRLSMSFGSGEHYANRQDFTFIRRDLLDQFLAVSSQHFVWAIYGVARSLRIPC